MSMLIAADTDAHTLLHISAIDQEQMHLLIAMEVTPNQSQNEKFQ